MIAKLIRFELLKTKTVRHFLFLGVIAFLAQAIFNANSLRAQMSKLYGYDDDALNITSLMSAVSNNDVVGVGFFSKAGSALVNKQNIGGATALHIAAREANLEIVKILVENGADVNLVDNEGWTPAMRAALVGDAKIIDFLISKGAKLNQTNVVGESAIIHAATSSCSTCLGAMFEKYNFIKLMNFALLKTQLNSAFEIAHNHENQELQTIINAYLDKVIKSEPLISQSSDQAEVIESDLGAIGNGVKSLINKIDKKIKFIFKSDSAAQDKQSEVFEVQKPREEIAKQPKPITETNLVEKPLEPINPAKRYKFSKVKEEEKPVVELSLGSEKAETKAAETKPAVETIKKPKFKFAASKIEAKPEVKAEEKVVTPLTTKTPEFISAAPEASSSIIAKTQKDSATAPAAVETKTLPLSASTVRKFKLTSPKN